VSHITNAVHQRKQIIRRRWGQIKAGRLHEELHHIVRLSYYSTPPLNYSRDNDMMEERVEKKKCFENNKMVEDLLIEPGC
jgi:hypothetical protein